MQFLNAWILVLFSAVTGIAQLQQESRFEIPLLDEDRVGYEVAGAQEAGVVLYKTYYGEARDQIELIRLDSALKKKWEGFITVEKDFTPFASQVLNNRCFFLLRNESNPFANFKLLSVDLDSSVYVLRTIRNNIPFNPTEFLAVNGAVFIGGYFNYRPLVLHYSWQNDQSRVLPGFFYEQGEITQMKDVGNGSVDIIVSARFFDKKKSLWIRNYSLEGDLNKTIILQADPDKHLLFGRTVTMPDGSQLVSGVYGRNIEYSRGVFVAKVDAMGSYTIRYYNFAELQHFFKFMKAKREERVKKRIERRKIKGKKNRFNYRLMVDDLILVNGEIVMLGEAFYPRYVYPNRSISMAPIAGTFGGGNLIFDGYYYTHAVAIGFTPEGKIKWDNSFEINDVKTFRLVQLVKAVPRPDHMSLLYLFGNDIRTKSIIGSQMLEGKTKVPLQPLLKSDAVIEKSTFRSNLQRWYNDTFYAAGVQRIKNMADAGVPSERKVFFINKVVYK
jgi:hypothetical protein